MTSNIDTSILASLKKLFNNKLLVIKFQTSFILAFFSGLFYTTLLTVILLITPIVENNATDRTWTGFYLAILLFFSFPLIIACFALIFEVFDELRLLGINQKLINNSSFNFLKEKGFKIQADEFLEGIWKGFPVKIHYGRNPYKKIQKEGKNKTVPMEGVIFRLFAQIDERFMDIPTDSYFNTKVITLNLIKNSNHRIAVVVITLEGQKQHISLSILENIFKRFEKLVQEFDLQIPEKDYVDEAHKVFNDKSIFFD